MIRPIAAALAGAALLACTQGAAAFCGFYVGKADASLFNEASQVIVVRDGPRTVISMLNDYRGEPTDFALVVPVPQVLQKGQVHVGDKKIFERLDAYSAPRLVEYFDPDPCRPPVVYAPAPTMAVQEGTAVRRRGADALGVTVESSFTVGEYDIVILSAKQSDGLETWLHDNGYRIPAGAAKALAPYIKQDMKFFVAKVNLKEQAKTGFTYLRPLQFAFESEKFMLPLRLGMINASGPQDLVAFMLTRKGRVETSNYRTVKLPANVDVPEFVKGEFPAFYKALFGEQATREGLKAVFTEYFWDMAWCDPCAADPLSPAELRQAGVFWVSEGAQPPAVNPRIAPMPPGGGAQPVMLTRLHLRYTPDTFPEDLMFQETADRQNFQARYVLRHAAEVAPDACPQAKTYLEQLGQRREQEAQQLASLTGWNINDIRRKAKLDGPAPTAPKWWENLWK